MRVLVALVTQGLNPHQDGLPDLVAKRARGVGVVEAAAEASTVDRPTLAPHDHPKRVTTAHPVSSETHRELVMTTKSYLMSSSVSRRRLGDEG